jgi:predicted lactoylglutathione lyase
MDSSAAALTLLTICVTDLVKSAAFYEALGFRRRAAQSRRCCVL